VRQNAAALDLQKANIMSIKSIDAARAELEAIRVWDLYFLLGETCSQGDLDSYYARQVRRKEILKEVYDLHDRLGHQGR
jgi:hypothetical protein